MKYEFVLKEKIGPSVGYDRLGLIVVDEVDFDNQLRSYQKYVESHGQIHHDHPGD